jgi:hypothetical protein
MALFEICGVNSRSNFKTTEHDELEDVLSSFNNIGNPCQLALPPLNCVSFVLNLLIVRSVSCHYHTLSVNVYSSSQVTHTARTQLMNMAEK